MFLYHSDDQQRCPNLLMMQRLLCPLKFAPNIAKVQKSLCSGWRPSVLPPREKKSPIYRQFRHPAVMTHWLAAITGERSKYGGSVTKTKQACSGSWLLNKNQSSVFQVKEISDQKLVFLPHLFLCRIWVMVHKERSGNHCTCLFCPATYLASIWFTFWWPLCPLYSATTCSWFAFWSSCTAASLYQGARASSLLQWPAYTVGGLWQRARPPLCLCARCEPT